MVVSFVRGFYATDLLVYLLCMYVTPCSAAQPIFATSQISRLISQTDIYIYIIYIFIFICFMYVYICNVM